MSATTAPTSTAAPAPSVTVPTAHGATGTTPDPLGEMVGGFGILDRGFGRAIAVGYVLGFLAIGALMAVILSVQTTLPLGAVIGASIGVAFWIGVMGGVVAVGMWSGRHEQELFGGH
jgi:hypothetical protein